jgi:hypothetical protein
VRVDCLHQLEVKLFDELEVSSDLLQYRIMISASPWRRLARR